MHASAALLDHVARELSAAQDNAPRVHAVVDELTWQLRKMRRGVTDAEWKDSVLRSRSHPLFRLLQEEPITRASFAKSRGYPGDAGLLDLIYGEPEANCIVAETSVLGRNLYQRNRDTPSCRAVRYRKALLAQRILGNSGRVLSVACGHLREVRQLATGLPSLHVTAFDQDEQSLAEIRRTLPAERVSNVRGSVRQILNGRLASSGFDFIYAAGLYDYLSVPVAQRLTRILFEKLTPNGTLLFTNFSRESEDAAYMEMFGDWWLLYRDEADMLEITSAVPRSEVAEMQLCRDPDRHLVVAELRRRVGETSVMERAA